MTSEERVIQTLNHKEPDRVAYDLGSTLITGIHIDAYKNLLWYLGDKRTDFSILRERMGLAKVHEDILSKLKVDIRGIFPNEAPKIYSQDDKYKYYHDEWGVKWRQPLKDGRYFDLYKSPLSGDLTTEGLDKYPWPNLTESRIFEGLAERAKTLKATTGCALVLEGFMGGEVFDGSFWLRGYEDFFMDLASDPSLACYLMDKKLEFQLQYWEMALEELKQHVLIVRIGDDLGEQTNTRISPEMYRKYIKPRHKKLISSIKQMTAGNVYIFFHSDGSICDLIPDLIEIGVDVLNPVQYTAAKMEAKQLKKEFGNELTFWGGGVDTQHILPHGSPEQVKEEVKRRIDDFAPGGGFVFCPVHNIQYDIPPQNIIAMWEALQEFGVY